jgi:hypothetical protein
MFDRHVFGRFVDRTAARDSRGVERATIRGPTERYTRRLMSAAAALLCSSATLSCALAALAYGPVAGVIQLY